jgi:hypothetical protein
VDSPTKYIIYLGRELDESVFKYYYLGYGPFRLNFDSEFLQNFKRTSKTESTNKDPNFSKFDLDLDLYAKDPKYDDVGFIGLEFVRGSGINLNNGTLEINLKLILGDLVDLLYIGFKDIIEDMTKEIEINFLAENKAGIILSILHMCLRLLNLSEQDRKYYSSFTEFDTSYCEVLDPEKKEVKWLQDNIHKSAVINPFIGSTSWQNHNLLLLLNGVFDEESLFPLSEKLLQSQINLSTPNEKFFKVEEEYFNSITEATGIKYSTHISSAEFNSFFDSYLTTDFYNLINSNYDFRQFFSISKDLVSPRNEEVRFKLDDNIRSFNIDNYYLAGLMSNFYVYVSDGSFKCSIYYLKNRFNRFKDVFKINFEFMYILPNCNDFVTLNSLEYKNILDNLI